MRENFPSEDCVLLRCNGFPQNIKEGFKIFKLNTEIKQTTYFYKDFITILNAIWKKIANDF